MAAPLPWFRAHASHSRPGTRSPESSCAMATALCPFPWPLSNAPRRRRLHHHPQWVETVSGECPPLRVGNSIGSRPLPPNPPFAPHQSGLRQFHRALRHGASGSGDEGRRAHRRQPRRVEKAAGSGSLIASRPPNPVRAAAAGLSPAGWLPISPDNAVPRTELSVPLSV
jgi:hypothetical protein